MLSNNWQNLVESKTYKIPYYFAHFKALVEYFLKNTPWEANNIDIDKNNQTLTIKLWTEDNPKNSQIRLWNVWNYEINIFDSEDILQYQHGWENPWFKKITCVRSGNSLNVTYMNALEYSKFLDFCSETFKFLEWVKRDNQKSVKK